MAITGLADGAMGEARFASGLRGVQSSGGKETLQKLGDGLAKAIPTSGISVDPGLMSTTVHAISSLVARFFIRIASPVRTGTRS